MKKNVGNIDRWIRIVLGLALISLLFILQSGWRWVGLLGVVLVATAALNFCPIYAIFKIKTTRKEN